MYPVKSISMSFNDETSQKRKTLKGANMSAASPQMQMGGMPQISLGSPQMQMGGGGQMAPPLYPIMPQVHPATPNQYPMNFADMLRQMIAQSSHPNLAQILQKLTGMNYGRYGSLFGSAANSWFGNYGR